MTNTIKRTNEEGTATLHMSPCDGRIMVHIADQERGESTNILLSLSSLRAMIEAAGDMVETDD